MPTKPGDRIRVNKEGTLEWGQVVYPSGSEWTVREVVFKESGLVFCDGNKYGIYASDYEIIQ